MKEKLEKIFDAIPPIIKDMGDKILIQETYELRGVCLNVIEEWFERNDVEYYRMGKQTIILPITRKNEIIINKNQVL